MYMYIPEAPETEHVTHELVVPTEKHTNCFASVVAPTRVVYLITRNCISFYLQVCDSSSAIWLLKRSSAIHMFV